MSRVAVTGAAGFVGSHLVDQLLREGHEVLGLDNLVTGSAKNLAHLQKEPKFSFIEADISSGIPDMGKVEGLFHLASPASPVDFVKLALPILKVGSYGTFHCLEYARNCGAWFMMASTSEVYGDPEVHPQPETYLGNVDCTGVRGVYDEAKRFSEAVTMAYHRTYHSPVSIIRIFNTYGPRMRQSDGRVIPNFISQALSGEPLTVYGDGSQTRSLCYVDDLVSGIYRMFEVRPLGPVNLGNEREMSMKELAQAIVRFTGSKSTLDFRPLPEGDPKQRRPDLTRARKLLGYEPKVSFDDGLKRTVDYFKSIL